MLKTNKYINYIDLVWFAWKTVTSNIVFFVWVALSYIAVWAVFVIPSFYIQFTAAMHNQGHIQPDYIIPYTVIQVLSAIFNVVITIGWVRIGLAFCDGYKPTVGMLFNFHGCFWRFLGVLLLFYLIIAAGIVLLVVPAMIWGVKYSMAMFFVIDKGLGPIEALKASARATNGMKWHWLGLMMVSSFVMMLGLMCLYVGGIISYPMGLIIMALGYRQLSAQTPELAEFGIATIASHPPREEMQNSLTQEI